MQQPKYRPRLNAGKLNRRIAIQKKGRLVDDAGFPVKDPWEDVFNPLWSHREPIRGREFFAAAAAQAETTVRYKIRFREGITSDMRLVDLKDNRTYELTAVLDDVFNDRTETHLMAKELTNG
ncbi:phage head closure protein [Paenibacillus sp. JCM 10914]|uniref:phage head closure protein n=1 Tax=Paenibacillus sp. JCM 10914 TaxID=1236974 RepID=UPI0003CC6A02|nr:phage head closure protein [Paenibacillus sp. JCM 10914]GAE09621.1 phage head-tail adaptor, putative [Paenibacillus sp. JCM 10914]